MTASKAGETPRVYAEAQRILTNIHSDNSAWNDMLNFARTLERELSESAIDQLNLMARLEASEARVAEEELAADDANLSRIAAEEERELLRSQLSAAELDAWRLDALQSTTKGYGAGWILRESTSDRGMRLHETTQEGAQPSVREAIDAALRRSAP